MPRLATRLLLPCMAWYCLHPFSSFACAIVPPERQAEVHAQDVEACKARVAAIKEEADLIFVGYLARLTFSRQPAISASGQESAVQTYRAEFRASEQVKGEYQESRVLEYTIDKNRVVVGCGPEFRQLPKENGAGERYLMYARDGKIIRTNPIPTAPQILTACEETAFIRGLP